MAAKKTKPMSDAKFIELTRKSVENPPPADADPNTIREYNGRVAYLKHIDGGGKIR